MTTRTTRSLLLFLCLLAGRVLAQAPIDIDKDFAAGSNKRFADLVSKGQTSIYNEVLAAYDAHLKKYPDDVTGSIERCRFIETFAYAEDTVIESSNDDLEACREQLQQGPHAGNTEVILYGIEGWEEGNAQKAQALIPQSRGWTRDQRATLYELLSDRFNWKEPELGAQYAMQAVELRPGSRVLLTAVERYIQLGAKDKARRLLLNAPADTWNSVSRVRAAQLLIELDQPAAAADILKAGEKDAANQNNMMLARIMAGSGQYDAAREFFRAAVDGKYVAYDDRVEFFDFERQHGSRDQAIAAYDQLRNEGFGADILGRQRLSLFVAYPSAPWHWRDAWGPLIFLAVLLIFVAVPLLPIVPVHYRGLARRVAGLPPGKPDPRWKLRHAWYALGVISVGGAIALYVFSPAYLEMMLAWAKREKASATDIELGKQLLFATLLTLVLVIPLLRRRPVKMILLGRWSVVKSVLVGIGAAIALKVLAIIIGVGLQSAGALGNDTMRAMQGAHQLFGLAGMLLIVAVAVPFVEELVFRGVLLESFRGQVTFAFAAVMQAATFAASHESWSDMPVLFLFGLLAAWLAKRSEGLLASMAMHSAFNFSSALAILGLTSFLNR